jgi:hypothetical protein
LKNAKCSIGAITNSLQAQLIDWWAHKDTNLLPADDSIHPFSQLGANGNIAPKDYSCFPNRRTSSEPTQCVT